MANSTIEAPRMDATSHKFDAGTTLTIEFPHYQTSAYIMVGIDYNDFCEILFSNGYFNKRTSGTSSNITVTFDQTTYRKITLKNNSSTGNGQVLIVCDSKAKPTIT